MGIKEFIGWVTLKDLRQGLGVTLKHLRRPVVTYPYPKQEFLAEERWRGLHTLWKDENTGLERCIGCCLCEKICPNWAITITTSHADDGKKVVDEFIVNAGRCLYCGFCAEVCPVRAIRQSTDYARKVHKRGDIILNKKELLERGGQD